MCALRSSFSVKQTGGSFPGNLLKTNDPEELSWSFYLQFKIDL